MGKYPLIVRNCCSLIFLFAFSNMGCNKTITSKNSNNETTNAEEIFFPYGDNGNMITVESIPATKKRYFSIATFTYNKRNRKVYCIWEEVYGNRNPFMFLDDGIVKDRLEDALAELAVYKSFCLSFDDGGLLSTETFKCRQITEKEKDDVKKYFQVK